MPKLTVENADPQRSARASNLLSVQKYRTKHRRIDYVPSAAVMAVLNTWHAKGLCNCWAGVIDKLVLAGDRVMSGHCDAQSDSKVAK